MKILSKIIKYEINDLLRSKWLIIYGVFFWLCTDLLFRFGSSGGAVVVSLMNIVLIFIPLVSLIFGMIYLYNSREFIELLLTQPIDRKRMFQGMYFGLSLPLCFAYILGIYIPALYIGIDSNSQSAFFNLILTGIALTFIFTAIAFLISTKFEDKLKGLGIAILTWLFFIVIYDGTVLLVLFFFSDYPLDNISIIGEANENSISNPFDGNPLFATFTAVVLNFLTFTRAL